MNDKNSASMDPFRDGGLYDQYIKSVVEPMQELQGEYIDEEWSQELDDYVKQLEAQEYQPAPHLEPDTRTGFDSEGNYHVDIRPNIPYRIAEEIQQFVLSQTVLSDYDLSVDERHEIAYAYALHLIDQNAFSDEMVAFDALQLWRIQHGRSRG